MKDRERERKTEKEEMLMMVEAVFLHKSHYHKNMKKHTCITTFVDFMKSYFL